MGKILSIGIFCCLITSTNIGAQDTIPFLLTPKNNISVKAQLNGQDTIALMFHTAVTEVGLIATVAEKLLKIDSAQSVEAYSWGGTGEARYVLNNQLQIGSFLVDSLTIWIGQLSGQGTEGKFGPSFFKNQVVEINFEDQQLLIHKALPADLLKRGFKKFALSYEHGMMFLKAELRLGAKVFEHSFMIHTGYGGALLLDDELVRKQGVGAQVEVLSESELRDSYGNVLKTKKGLLPGLDLGGHDFEAVPISFFEGGLDRQKYSVVGGSLLKRFHILFDEANATVYLKPNALMDLPFKGI